MEIGVKGAYARDWLENRLSTTIARLMTGMLGQPVIPRFKVWSATKSTTDTAAPVVEIVSQAPPQESPNINSRYRFDNFVVGADNRLAHAACMAVAEKRRELTTPCSSTGVWAWVRPTCCTPSGMHACPKD